MAERILTDKKVEEIKDDIKLNGGVPVDMNLEELQEYLRRNPPETVYLEN